MGSVDWYGDRSYTAANFSLCADTKLINVVPVINHLGLTVISEVKHLCRPQRMHVMGVVRCGNECYSTGADDVLAKIVCHYLCGQWIQISTKLVHQPHRSA